VRQAPLWERSVAADEQPTVAAPSAQRGTRVDVAPGAVWLRHYLDDDLQHVLLDQARALLDGPAGGYVPVVRGGGRMHVRMLCLGRHWNARTYRYEPSRCDVDDAPASPLPAEWRALAQRVAGDAGFVFAPDICIVNWYDVDDGRMGMHQDKDESAVSLASGAPIVSLSIGDTGRFLFGGHHRREPVQTLMLESGDAFVFGGESRLRYHGISRIVAGTAPPVLDVRGRLNLTFRQY
jgi:alkylated DNA repair protein (DNA oxidative demethylase)